MSYQLWISPITGYRRRGTRTAELRNVYEQGLTTRILYEPLRCCHLDDPAHEVRDEMARLDFDVVGALEKEQGGAVGYVTREDLTERGCREAMRPFAHADLVSDSTPLIDLLQALSSTERLFVLAGNRVRGIVTRADLQKPPMRVLLFGLISMLEMHLTFWVATEYPGEAWKQALSPKRVEAARALLEQRKQHNEEISEFDCIQFCDKRDLAIDKDVVRERMQLGSKNAAGKVLRAAEELRNGLAHSLGELATSESWPELASLVKSIEGFLTASDQAVEEMVRKGEAREPILGVAI